MRAAAPAIGPLGLCGAIPIFATAAAAEIFLASNNPPQ